MGGNFDPYTSSLIDVIPADDDADHDSSNGFFIAFASFFGVEFGNEENNFESYTALATLDWGQTGPRGIEIGSNNFPSANIVLTSDEYKNINCKENGDYYLRVGDRAKPVSPVITQKYCKNLPIIALLFD